MSRIITPRRILAGIVVLLLLFFVPPFIRLNKFAKGRIVEALAKAIDRPVSVKNVSLQLLPRPGLVLEDFMVQEDPAFGAEPMLRARQVTAVPRLSSLWRARLEIGRLQLQEPSLNLVRSADGRWNVEALLNRATHTPVAPTSKLRPEARSRFPYIEATAGRINFKSGPEKMVWAFSEADFALWLESEDLWNMRLQAQPVRTDANLSDTGTLKLSGSFHRTQNLRDTPLNVHVVLERAQLGQLTRLIEGRDRGWRGAVYLNAILAGTPAALNITSDLNVDDFRRYDILTPDGLRLSAQCKGQYQLRVHGFTTVECRVPEDEGEVTVRGDVSNVVSGRTYELAIAAERVPVANLLRLFRHAKRGVPDDLQASGVVNAAFKVRNTDAGSPAVWVGSGSAEDLTLEARALTPPLTIEKIAFARAEAQTSSSVLAAGARSGSKTTRRKAMASNTTGWTVGPFPASLGGTSPLMVEAILSRDGYSAHLTGDPDLGRMLALVRSLGGRAPQLTAKGPAAVNVAVVGKWSGFAAVESSGTMQLRNVDITVRGVNAPVRFANAQIAFSPDDVKITGISASFAGSRTHWQGTTSYPRACTAGEICPIHVDLHADELSSDDLNRLFNPKVARKWYQFGGAGSALSGLAVDGRISADRLAVKSIMAQEVTTQLKLESGMLRLSDFRATVLGGMLRGEWQANLSADPPAYSGTGHLDRASMAQIAQAADHAQTSGTLSATYKVALNGWSEPELLASSAGTVEFTWAGGSLRSAALDSSGAALQINVLTAQGEWSKGRLELTTGRMETPGGIYQITGTAGRQLNLKVRSGNARMYLLSGTLDQPRVVAVSTSDTQASLKP